MQRILLVLLFLAVALPVIAEEIALKDGTKIVGHMTSITADKIEVETAYGKIQLKRSDILSINFPENGFQASAASSPRHSKLSSTITSPPKSPASAPPYSTPAAPNS